MKNIFIYPTRKNMIIGFLIMQLLPLYFYTQRSTNEGIPFWVFQFELVILGILCLWRPMPREDMDEREKQIELKWNDRMFQTNTTLIMILVFLPFMKPEMTAMELVPYYTVPVFVSMIAISLLYKRELGGFFFKKSSVDSLDDNL